MEVALHGTTYPNVARIKGKKKSPQKGDESPRLLTFLSSRKNKGLDGNLRRRGKESSWGLPREFTLRLRQRSRKETSIGRKGEALSAWRSHPLRLREGVMSPAWEGQFSPKASRKPDKREGKPSIRLLGRKRPTLQEKEGACE